MQPPSRRSSRSAAMSVAVLYGLFGMIWVAASDWVVETLVKDPATLTVIQTSKGWLFVVASAALIFLAGWRLMQRIDESEARYRTLFTASPEPMVLYDPHSLQLVEANEAACLLIGYDKDEIPTLSVPDVLPAEGAALLQRELPRLRSGVARTGLWRVLRKDGTVLDVSIQGHPVAIRGRPLRLVTIEDVSIRLRAEAEMLRSLEQASAANEQVREVAHAVTHDLQEPLRQVASFAQLLERRYGGRLDAEGEQYVGFMLEGVNRLKELLRDVEAYAAGPSIETQPVDMGRVVLTVLARMRSSLDGSGITVCVGEMPVIHADRDKMAVVLGALLDNAVKFRAMDREPRISVEAGRMGEGWKFCVRDNGIGIEPQYHETVFSLFKRLHPRDRFAGNGTGLALARKLVEAHGGRVWIESAAGRGAAFHFTVPEPQPRQPPALLAATQH